MNKPLTVDDFERRNPTHPILAVGISISGIKACEDPMTLFYMNKAAARYFESELRERDGKPYWLPNAEVWPSDIEEQAALLKCDPEWWKQRQFEWKIFKADIDPFLVKMKHRSAIEETKQLNRWAKKNNVVIEEPKGVSSTTADFEEDE